MLTLLRDAGVINDQARIGAVSSIFGGKKLRTAQSSAGSSYGAVATKWCIGWCLALTSSGASRAAIGSTLLRSPGGSSPARCKRLPAVCMAGGIP
jgi:hypothetical protein